MESANIHHHLQDQLAAVSSSSSSSTLATTVPSNFYGPAGTHASWNLHSFLNTNGLRSPCPSETIFLNPRNQEDTSLLSSSQYIMSSMAPDMGFHWPNSTTAAALSTIISNQDLQMSRIKEEISSAADNYNFLKYSNEIILNSNSPSSSCSNDEFLSLQRNEPRNNSNNNNNSSNINDNNMGSKLMLKSLPSGNLMNKTNQVSPHVDLYGACGRGGFSQIFPSINISNMNNNINNNNQVKYLEEVANANPGGGCLDMNMEALDLLTSSRFGGGSCFDPSSSQNQVGFLRDGFSFNGFDHMQQCHQLPLDSSSKISALSNNGSAIEGKRASNKMEPKAIQTSAPKKSRLEARASCPPLKVRKEKLGDRIAALQQLVAPFGKTDTASVLMEAIGYIKFLQNQVETLSVPYMKTSRNKTSRITKGGVGEIENEEPRRDLKSRGLCLVPLSCLSYIADGGGAAVWPPPHFGCNTG